MFYFAALGPNEENSITLQSYCMGGGGGASTLKGME